jgi:hypothetical protein
VPSWRTCNNRRRKAARWVRDFPPAHIDPSLRRFIRLLEAQREENAAFVREARIRWHAGLVVERGGMTRPMTREELDRDERAYGISITRDGERIDPLNFFTDPAGE